MHQKFIVFLKWNMLIPFIYSNSILCTYYPLHCKSLEYRIVGFWFYYWICPVHINFDTLSHFLHHNLFIINRGCSLSLPSFLCPSSTSFTIRDIMFIGYYVLLIWQTIISKEKSKNHFKHRLSRWKLPADTPIATAAKYHSQFYPLAKIRFIVK